MKEAKDRDYSWQCDVCTFNNEGKYATSHKCHLCCSERQSKHSDKRKSVTETSSVDIPKKKTAKVSLESTLPLLEQNDQALLDIDANSIGNREASIATTTYATGVGYGSKGYLLGLENGYSQQHLTTATSTGASIHPMCGQMCGQIGKENHGSVCAGGANGVPNCPSHNRPCRVVFSHGRLFFECTMPFGDQCTLFECSLSVSSSASSTLTHDNCRAESTDIDRQRTQHDTARKLTPEEHAFRLKLDSESTSSKPSSNRKTTSVITSTVGGIGETNVDRQYTQRSSAKTSRKDKLDVMSARIDPNISRHRQELSRLSDHIPPDDWNVKGRYDVRLQKIFAQWLLVEKEIKSRPTKNGEEPFINGPCLPWYKPVNERLFSQCMAYLTLQESNMYVKRGGHTSNVVKTEDGHLSSSCFDLVRMSQTDSIYFDSFLQLMLSYGGENELQLWAQRELKRLCIQCDDPTVAMSIYQRHMFEIGSNALVVDAKSKLEAAGHSTKGMTPKEILAAHYQYGSNPLVKNAKTQLEAAGHSTEGMTSKELISAEASRKNKLKMADETHKLLHLNQEQKNKKNINNRLSNMKRALPTWSERFDEFKKEGVRPSGSVYASEHSWLRDQRSRGVSGLRQKAAFEKAHSTETEWQENLVLLKDFLSTQWDITF